MTILCKTYFFNTGGTECTREKEDEVLVELDDEAVEKFVEEQKNKNTKRKTDSDLRTWYTWCEKHGETRKLKDVPPAELDRLRPLLCFSPQEGWFTVRTRYAVIFSPQH